MTTVRFLMRWFRDKPAQTKFRAEARVIAVKVQPVVEPHLRQLDEVAGADRHLVLIDLGSEATERGLERRGRIRHGERLITAAHSRR